MLTCTYDDVAKEGLALALTIIARERPVSICVERVMVNHWDFLYRVTAVDISVDGVIALEAALGKRPAIALAEPARDQR